MTRYDTDAENRTDPRPAYIPLGVDALGESHVYRTTDETVFVIDDSALSHREALDGRSVDSWMAYVSDRRGWTSRRYYATLGDAVENCVEAE